jgi:hypothetical protein
VAILFPCPAQARGHLFLIFYWHVMTAQVREQDQLGKLDFLVVEGVMEMMQWANRGGEQQAGGQSLANHHWRAVLVALTHEEGLDAKIF